MSWAARKDKAEFIFASFALYRRLQEFCWHMRCKQRSLALVEESEMTAMRHIIYLVLVMSTACGTNLVTSSNQPLKLGSTEMVTEDSSGLPFRARIDTGAHTCSIHYDDMIIEGESDKPHENVGKPVHFLLKNSRGQSEWITAKIADYVQVRTSERSSGRYKVRLSLSCRDVSKDVLVSLNKRDHMDYPMLIGRNFLRGDFVVAVD
jgi:hypothetical protein